MKFLFVSRKKYDITKSNYEKSVKHRQDLQKRNEELQRKVMELEDKIKELGPKRENEVLRRCYKCNKYFTTPKVSKRTICLDCKTKKKGDE